MERIVLALLTLTAWGGLTDIINVKALICPDFSSPTECLILSIQSKTQVSLSLFFNLSLKLQSSSAVFTAWSQPSSQPVSNSSQHIILHTLGNLDVSKPAVLYTFKPLPGLWLSLPGKLTCLLGNLFIILSPDQI